MGILLDQYTVAARIRPVVLVLVPVAVSVLAHAPDRWKLPVGGGAGFVLLAIGTMVGQLGRDFGKRKERSLWAVWGGAPTVQFLRHRDNRFNAQTRERCRAKLAELAPDLKLPTADEEREKPRAADEVYEAATKLLISRTRNKKEFPLLFAENASYGFRRNLWGMKPLGVVLSVAGSAFCIAQAWAEYRAGALSGLTGVSVAVNISLVAAWLLWVSPNMVRLAAEAYAERLLEACEKLEPSGARSS